MRVFNTTGLCVPEKHYMVDITERLEQIKTMVDAGKYFCINRSRQYGKTTTLYALSSYLRNAYEVMSLDFQSIGYDGFSNEGTFVREFSKVILDAREFGGLLIPQESLDALVRFSESDTDQWKLSDLFRTLQRWMKNSDKPLVLMIDEVDSASDYQTFLDFLAQLRFQYLEKEKRADYPAFRSVILAGVTDIRHLRSKIRDEDQHKVNSPWNIASDFDIDMSLSREGIEGMLGDYEADHNTGMDAALIAKELRDYTAGYPFLVSRLCQIMAEKLAPETLPDLSAAWTKRGVEEAVKILQTESNALFDSLSGKMTNFPELKERLKSVLMRGERMPFNIYQEDQAQMYRYGFICNQGNAVAIANRIFETFLYNYFLSDEDMKQNKFNREGDYDRNIFIEDGTLNMRLILERFIDAYTKIFGPLKDRFPEKDGRELFLLYLRPIINGTGNYYIEAQTRDQTRTDVVVDYLGQQYVVELKIWRGDRYNERGEKQVREYLDYFDLDTGYMLSFNFNQNKETGVKRVDVDGKVLYEGTV